MAQRRRKRQRKKVRMSQSGHALAWDTLNSETGKLKMETTASGALTSLHPDLLWLDLALA
jgi:hypothetical protein